MTDTEKQKCAEWTRAHSKHWQVLKRSQWKYEWRGKALVRYLDNVSMRELQDGLLLEYLCSADCKENLSLYSQDVSDEWTPTSAWYESMSTRAPANGILQVRLYHALRTDVEADGDGPYTVENGCMWKVTWKFFWKQTEVAALPASSSGVNYRITGLNRDDEDGTFSYVLERRERVQQDVGPYNAEVDAFETVERESHSGVKGDISDGGVPASVSLGVVVSRSVTKNDDCTHTTDNAKVTSNEVVGAVTETSVGLHGASTLQVNRNMRAKADETGLSAGQSVRNEENKDLTWNQTIRSWRESFYQWLRGVCRKTIFRHTHSTTVAVGTDPGFEHAEDAGGGVIHETDVQRTETGWDKTETTHIDSPVADAVVEVHKGVDGVVTRIVNRNQSGPASTASLGIGDTVRNEKTESGLVDQTITTAESEDVGRVAEECDKNALVHSHTETEVVSSANAMATVDADEVANGVIHSVRVQMTESGGWRETETTRTASPAQSTVAGGSTGRTVTVTTLRNQSGIPDGAPSVNREIDVTASPNEFGLEDGSVRVVEHNPETTTSRGGTQLYTEDTTVTTNDTDVNPAQESTRGTVVLTHASPTGYGSANVTKTVRTAIPHIVHKTWTDTSISASRTTVHRRKLTVFRNREDLPEIDTSFDSCYPNVNINEFGLYDGFYSYSALESDTPNTSVAKKGTDPDEQWDNRYTHTVYEYSPWYDVKYGTHGGQKTRSVRSFTVTIRALYSTAKNCMDEVAKHPGYPEYGLISKMHGAYAIIYLDLDEEKTKATWEPTNEYIGEAT